MAGMDILVARNLTKVIREAEDNLQKEGGLTWYPRTPVVNRSQNEMTAHYTSRIYASDIISEDAEALTRESGRFRFLTSGTNKLKSGARLTESQIALMQSIKAGGFVGDNEIINFEGWVARNMREQLIGTYQRVEAMINGMFIGGYKYDRMGLRVEGDFGLASDNRTTVVKSHEETDSTPLTDVVTFLSDLDIRWGKRFPRITCRSAWVKAVTKTDEFKAEIARTLMPYSTINGLLELETANYRRHSDTIGAILSRLLGWDITVEIDENVYYEYQSSGVDREPNKFHPEEYLYFSGIPGAFDISNGPLVEALLDNMGLSNVIGGFKGAGNYGPMGYATPSSPDMNPPGITLWVTAWQAPALSDDRGIATMVWK